MQSLVGKHDAPSIELNRSSQSVVLGPQDGVVEWLEILSENYKIKTIL